MADRTRKKVRAERVEVVDAAGRVRAVLGTLADSGEVEAVGLALFDRHGVERAWLATDDTDACGLTMYHDGNIVLSVDVQFSGEAMYALTDPDGSRFRGWSSFDPS